MTTRVELESESEFLFRSLEDLEAEHDAGDISDADYQALRDRYVARAAAVLRAIHESEASDLVPASEAPAGGSSGVDAPPQLSRRRRTRSRALLVAAVTSFVLAAVILLVDATGSRLPGNTITGSIVLSHAQRVQRELGQAAVLETRGDDLQALKVYRQVLSQDPHQPQALAEQGWLELEAGLAAHNGVLVQRGKDSIEASVAADPRGYAGHLYLGTIALDVEHDPAAAVAQYREFLGDSPPAQWMIQARPFIVKAFSLAGQQLPRSVSGS
jgi:hypothetical protein